MIQREPIFAALFALVGALPALKTKSRKLKHWADVPATQRPALFQAQGNQMLPAPAANGLPGRWTLTAKLYLYFSTTGATSPGEIANPVVDALTAMFEPNALGVPQTLGGLVHWARIEGTIETSEGTLGDDEVVIVPVMILAA